MELQITVQVGGIDLDDPATGDILAEEFPAFFWQGDGKSATVSFMVNADKAPEETLHKVRSLEAAIPGFKALRVDRDLVSTTEIAMRVGVSREAARKWGIEPDFPRPFGTPGDKNIWQWVEVLNWLDRSRGIELDECQPDEALMAQIDNCLMRNPDATTNAWRTLTLRQMVYAAQVPTFYGTHVPVNYPHGLLGLWVHSDALLSSSTPASRVQVATPTPAYETLPV